jgi:hypothetical protein
MLKSRQIILKHWLMQGAVDGGWEIENECFNTQKKSRYHLTHNYGHGKESLSDNMYILILLAFYFHQMFELLGKK